MHRAHNGEQALDYLFQKGKYAYDNAEVPRIVLLDINLPDRDGFSVLRELRDRYATIAVIMLSSSDHPADIKRAAEAGAQCYLAKYPQPGVLKEVVGEAERFALGAPADECFRMPSNLLLVRGRRV